MSFWSALSAGQGAVLGSVASGLFNQRSANKQMRFQDVSSRTQYQRAVADMKAAGLNPMLATKLGGNAAMSGAQATMPDLGATINNSAQAAKARAETANVPKQGDLLEAQAEAARMTAAEKKQKIYNLQQESLRIAEDTRRLIAETGNVQARTKLTELQQETERFNALFKKADSQIKAVTAVYYEKLKKEDVLFEALIPKLNYILVQAARGLDAVVEEQTRTSPAGRALQGRASGQMRRNR